MSNKPKEKKNFSIPPLPNPIFVIELKDHILVTGFPVKECVFPIYRFDNAYDEAFEAATDIAIKSNKNIANAVDFYLNDPHVYDPIELIARMKVVSESLAAARARVIAAHKELDEKK